VVAVRRATGLAADFGAGLTAAERRVADFGADLAADFGADLGADFGADLAADLAAGLAADFGADLAVRVDGRTEVVSSRPATTAFLRTDASPFSADALVPYAAEVATTAPLAARSENRNFPALSLVSVNFAGTVASLDGRSR
jgi:hypothetical protein